LPVLLLSRSATGDCDCRPVLSGADPSSVVVVNRCLAVVGLLPSFVFYSTVAVVVNVAQQMFLNP
jgi:hypothetical protein